MSLLWGVESAIAAQLTRWTFDPVTHRLELEIPGGTTPQYFLLAQPPRMVIDLPNTRMEGVPEVSTYSGMVQSIRVGQFQPELTRIVMEFTPDAVFSPGHITIQPLRERDNAIAASSVGTPETWLIRPLLVGQNPDADPEAVLVDEPESDFLTRNLPDLAASTLDLPSDSPLPQPERSVDETIEAPSPAFPPALEDETVASAASVATIEFGQAFQRQNANATANTNANANANDPNILIPAGTLLMLQYPRDVPLSLAVAKSRQEVLLTTTSVRDGNGNILVPSGSLVIGRFDRLAVNRLQFTAQALTFGDRTVPLDQAIADISPSTAIEPNQLIQLSLDAAIPR